MNISKWCLNWKTWTGVVAIVVAIIVWRSLIPDTPRLALFWLFGIAFGVIVQRSRFCFVSAISNFTLFRDGRLLKGILGGLFVSTVGFAIIMFKEIPNPSSGIPSGAYLSPFGWHLVLAGIIFGIGMVLASGCVMGTLYRIGEGSITALTALLGIIAGMGILQHNWPWWNNYISRLNAVWLPQHIGWIASLVLTLGVIVVLYCLLVRYQSKSTQAETESTRQPLSAHFRPFVKAVFVNSWPMALGGVLLGGLNIWLYASIQRPCGLTGELMRWTQIVLDIVHLPVAPLETVPGS